VSHQCSAKIGTFFFAILEFELRASGLLEALYHLSLSTITFTSLWNDRITEYEIPDYLLTFIFLAKLSVNLIAILWAGNELKCRAHA
jgi:hypothetical protein